MNALSPLSTMQERKIVLSSKPENLSIVESFIDQIQEDFKVKEDVYGNIVIALTEAANNAINHGNQKDADKNIIITAFLQNPFLLAITVEDEGSGFDPNALPDPTLPENMLSETGRGVFIMREISDSFEYLGNGNKLVMRFNI